MKITISFTIAEAEQAQRTQKVLLWLLGPGRVHSIQQGDRCIVYLTFRF